MLTLPFSLLMGDNHRLIPARVGKHTRLILNPEYREAKERVRLALMAMLPPFHPPFHPPADALSVHCACYFPDRRKRDATNYAKFVHDAMTGIVYHDDGQIADARQTKAIDRANPRIEITITAVAA